MVYISTKMITAAHPKRPKPGREGSAALINSQPRPPTHEQEALFTPHRTKLTNAQPPPGGAAQGATRNDRTPTMINSC
jgi:hypothetical protein